MTEYYTYEEWVAMVQAKLGVQVSPTNERFPSATCIGNVMRQVHQWQPVLPGKFQDSETETTWQSVFSNGISSIDTSIVKTSVDLPAKCAVVTDVNLPGETEQFIELYGFENIPSNVGDYAAYVERCQTLTRLNCGVRLLCKRGKRIVTYPTMTSAEAAATVMEVGMRVYIEEPTAGALLKVPKIAVPFHIAGAAADGKWPDLRAGESQALQAEFLTALKTVFGLEDRQKAQTQAVQS